MTSRQQQPVVKFRVPHHGFVTELREAALTVGETPSQFIRRAVAARIKQIEDRNENK